MVDSKEFVALQQDNKSEAKALRMAEVTELFENGTAKIMYRGEDIASEKEYSYLASYTPSVGDEVLLIPFLETYIIIGKILYQETEQHEDYVTPNELTSILDNYLKSSDLEDYPTLADVEDSIKMYLGWDSYGTINNTVTNGYNLFTQLKASKFYHSGSYLGFFGTTPTTKNSVSTLSTSADQAAIISRLNTLINALTRLGLV